MLSRLDTLLAKVRRRVEARVVRGAESETFCAKQKTVDAAATPANRPATRRTSPVPIARSPAAHSHGNRNDTRAAVDRLAAESAQKEKEERVKEARATERRLRLRKDKQELVVLFQNARALGFVRDVTGQPTGPAQLEAFPASEQGNLTCSERPRQSKSL
jgi:hypothetical protein